MANQLGDGSHDLDTRLDRDKEHEPALCHRARARLPEDAQRSLKLFAFFDAALECPGLGTSMIHESRSPGAGAALITWAGSRSMRVQLRVVGIQLNVSAFLDDDSEIRDITVIGAKVPS